ncbi:hypothetical protein [Flavobacterium hydrophilum]|uniref:Uncharacterized protein n=1 Tax=Flavobacterium hydrophilum TaxID=2211445 RepID=A0A2V4C876_9FLAO|nr:hypothetical protein [Flavobacterium hydrophilum]PXY46842.1 hypothetical protein DMB68_06730 [Flavobacterium hydrophilum]
MEIERKIDSSILNLYQLMPSTGEWPFTIMRIDRMQISGLPIETSSVSECLVLVLKRTDFDIEDISDYAKDSKEYGVVPTAYKQAFVESFVNKFDNTQEINQWTDNITSMGIGLIFQLTRQHRLELKTLRTLLYDLDFHIEFDAKMLQPYKLFEVIDLE